MTVRRSHPRSTPSSRYATSVATRANAEADSSKSVAERLRHSAASMTPGERKIARALMSDYPAAGLRTTAELARQAGVSAPTVVRFAVQLGFPGYREFQDALRAELSARVASPLTVESTVTTPDSLRQQAWTTLGGGLQQTMSTLLDADLDAAVRLLSDTRHPVVSFGGRFTRLAAEYLDLHLRMMRPNTRLLSWNQQPEAGFIADVGPRTVCVVFDVRRYQDDVIALAQLAAERGATIVLVTDPWMSPVAAVADVVLSAAVESVSSFDSLFSVIAVVDLLVADLYARTDKPSRQRIRSIEKGRDCLQKSTRPLQ